MEIPGPAAIRDVSSEGSSSSPPHAGSAATASMSAMQMKVFMPL